MEAEYGPNKDDLSTSTTTTYIANEAQLTSVNDLSTSTTTTHITDEAQLTPIYKDDLSTSTTTSYIVNEAQLTPINKDDLSTSTTTTHISDESQLTPINKNDISTSTTTTCFSNDTQLTPINKDDLSTSTTTTYITNEAQLTPINKYQENDNENNISYDSSIISDRSVNHQNNNGEQSDIQDGQFDNPYLQQTKSSKGSSYENPSFVSDNSRKNNCDSIELGSFYERQGSNPLFVSNCIVNLQKIGDKDLHNDNEDDLIFETEFPVNKYNDCANCNIQGYQNNILSLNPKYLEVLNTGISVNKLYLGDNVSNCNVNNSEKDINLGEISNFETHDIYNAEGDSNLKICFSGLSNSIGEISTLSGKFINSNDDNIDKINTKKHYRNCSWPSKTVTFERQQSYIRDQVILRGNNHRQSKRLSKTRLSQWGSRRKITPIGRQTSFPIVEGVNDQQLWSDARSLNRSALLVLWWSFLAVVMYILSFYDLWSDCSVAYYYWDIGEKRWCIISVLILTNSYFLQCCFSYYEVTHANHHHFGRLSSKKYAISLFLLMPWIIVCIGIIDTYKNKYTRRLETAYIMMFIEVIFESLAQTSLQLNAIVVHAHVNIEKVTTLQWVSVSSSILFLSVGIAYSVIFYNNKDATHRTKILFCIFGGITVVSRLLLCSSWALQNKFLWVLPFTAGLLTTALTWLVLRTYSRFGYKEFLHKYDINNLPMALVTSSSWLTSYIFNCFSPSGLPVSVFMCVLAWIDFSMKSGQSKFGDTLPIINICLTAFVLLCNIVFSCFPKCHVHSQTWVEGEGEDEDDPYHFRFY